MYNGNASLLVVEFLHHSHPFSANLVSSVNIKRVRNQSGSFMPKNVFFSIYAVFGFQAGGELLRV